MKDNETLEVWENPQDEHWEIADEHTPEWAKVFKVTRKEFHEHLQHINHMILMDR